MFIQVRLLILNHLSNNTYRKEEILMNIIEKFSKIKLWELFCYLVNGVATTIVNYTIYLALLHGKVNYLTANTIAWICAVLFAYISNRIFVFHSDNQVSTELFSFVSMRFLTLVLENALLAALIQWLSFTPGTSKILVSFITVIGNYFFCKCQIFDKKKGEIIHE